jgi:hypothetical protein
VIHGRARLADAQRRGCRREVRQNLLTAAQEAGTTEALRRIGNSQALAREYMSAEYGDRPRHSWIAAAWVAALIPTPACYVLMAAAIILAGRPWRIRPRGRSTAPRRSRA